MNITVEYVFGEWRVNPGLNLVSKDQILHELQPSAMNTLVYLLENADRTVSADEIVASVWKGRVVEIGAVARAISQLRRSLNDSAKEAKNIKTVRKRGYRLIAPVQKFCEEQPMPAADKSLQTTPNSTNSPSTPATDNFGAINPDAKASDVVFRVTREFNQLAIENPEVNEILFKAMSDVTQLSPVERNRFNALANVLFYGFQKIYYSLSDEERTSETWRGQTRTLAFILNNPGFRHRWEQLRPFLGGTFRNFVDSAVVDQQPA